MSNKKRLFEKTDLLVVCGILVAMMVIGSIWDYPISLALYDQSNWFGNLFAAYGEFFAGMAVLLSGLLLILAHNKEKKLVAVLQIIGAVLILLLGGAMTILMPGNYLPFPMFVSAIPGVAGAVLLVFYAIRISKTADRATMVKVAAVLFISVWLEIIVVNVIKIPWGRPRMRLIAQDIGAYFTPWWVAGGGLKAQLAHLGIESDQFKSFPSGHTANGAAAMLLALLPLLDKKLESKKRVLFYTGVVWGLLVALSRIIMGAHFVTDTTVGFAVTFVIILLMTSLLLKDKSLKGKAGD